MNHTTQPVQQDATGCLTPQQEQAVELLMSGVTVTAAAAAIGVSRETVHRWLRQDWGFVATMNRAKRERNEAASTRLLAVWARAAENLAKAVEDGDLRASLLVLKGFSVPFGESPSVGSDDPCRLAEEAELSQLEAQNASNLRRMMAAVSL